MTTHNTVASLPDRLAMHARDCAKAADMDTDVVLSREQINVMADDMAEAALALATPAGDGGLRELVNLLRQREPDNGEDHTDHDKGYEQASAEIADMLERILATPEQRGSAVQGEAPLGAIENGRVFADRLETSGFDCEAGKLSMCSDWQEFRRCFEWLAEWAMHEATPPPAPAAEQAQPEARGVEELRGLVRLWRTVEKNGERVTQFDKGYEQASDECADALETVLNSLATPNPVRAEQPEGKGEWPKNLLVLGAPIHAVYVPPGYAIDGVAMRDERVLRFVAAAPAAPVGVDEAMVARAEAYMLRVLPCKSTACLGGTFNFYELLTAALAGKAQEEPK